MPLPRSRLFRYLLQGIACWVSLCVQPSALHAEKLVHAPISVTFGANQLQGETSIWQLAEAANGQIIAAGERVGYYEDGRWEFLPEPRALMMRCLLVDGDTLWVSSANEIGKLSLPLSPQSRYQKLALPALESAGEIWYLARRGKTLIATTKDEVWFIDPAKNQTKHVRLPNQSRIFLHSLDEKLVVTSTGNPPWEVGDGQLVPMENPLPDQNDTVWFGTPPAIIVAKGIYQKEAGRYRLLTTLKKEGDPYLYTSVVQWANRLVVTTINKGLVFLEVDSLQTNAVTHPSALPSLGTTHALVDKAGRLWVATTRGIALFEPPRFGQFFPTTDYPLSAFRTDGLLINHEDRADYFPVADQPERLPRAFSVTPTTHGFATGFWGKLRIGDKVFKLHSASIGNTTELPSGNLLVPAGEGLHFIDYAAGRADLVDALKGEISGLAVVRDQLWAATFYGELFRSPPAPPFTFTKIADLPKNTTTTLHRLGDTLIAASAEQIFYGEPLKVVEHTSGLRKPLLATTADGAVWLLGEQHGHVRLGRLRQSGDSVAWETVEAKGLAQLADVHHLSASGGTLLITGASGILELNAGELKPAYRLAAPRLRFAFRDAQTGAATTRDGPPHELSANKNSVTFSGTLPFDEFGERPGFERRLLPTDTAWVPTRAGETVAYPSLSPDAYTLEVRATHLGRTGPVSRHAFTVLPPWYATTTAIGGYIVGAVLFSFVTYRVRTHQIRRRNRELERIVAVRTHELAEASAAKTEFLASMSHEIRNPMNGVIGLVNILREQPGLPRQANTLRLLHGCAEQLRATVDDILDFSKIEARRVGLELSTFDLCDTLEAAAATVDPTGASITFADKLPVGVGLRGDAAKLRQIFANYLNNALKYGVPPGAKVSTILTPAADDRLRLTLSVTSSGPTIEKDKLDKMFESFTRGDDAIERNIRGTGLGLAICKRFAEAMGGEVGAVSTNGETTFYLNVPFEKISAATVPALAAAASAPHPTLPARALAIEDEDYNRIVLGDILAKMNYTVDWATTGAEALQLAQENGYDIILTDYRLPDTNGVELTKKILQLCPVPKPAVFAVTAYSTRERRDECLAAGMSGFISKPITLEKLRTTLFSWGDRQLTTISLEASLRPVTPTRRTAEIEAGWIELKRVAALDQKLAAAQAHGLNNLCRSLHQIDLAEQLELLEGALERGEPTGQLVAAIERLLRV